jgi:DNA polymerase-1
MGGVVMTQKLLLIDGSGFIFRAYHSLPPLTNPAGVPVGAVYGFVNMVTKVMNNQHVTHAAVIFDAARKTFRNELYADYKAHRPPAPEDLVPQFPLVRDATIAMNLPAIELDNFEADDIIATYAEQAKALGMEVVIISSDKDLMQLIDTGVSLFDAMKNKPIGEAQVFEKFGVTPDKVIEVQALIGDSSDNVPGVKSIGPKTAAELINEFGSVEHLLENLDKIKQPKRREVLQTYAELALLSKQLVTLKRDCVGIPAIDTLVLKPTDIEQLSAFVREHGFNSLASRLGSKPAGSPRYAASQQKPAAGAASAPDGNENTDAAPMPSAPRGTYELVTSVDALMRWLDAARAKGYVAFDTETDGLNARTGTLVGFSLAVEEGRACYVPLNHTQMVLRDTVLDTVQDAPTLAQGDLFGGGDVLVAAQPTNVQEQVLERAQGQLSEKVALAMLKPLLEDASVLKIGQNIKFDALVLSNRGVDITPIDDTLLLSYCLRAGAGRHGMDALAKELLNYETVSFESVVGKGKHQLTFDRVPLDKACEYAAEDADITLRLWNVLKPRVISEKLLSVYERMERPLVPVIRRMEYAGVLVDAQRLAQLSSEFAAQIASLEAEIHTMAGMVFAIASPKQLGEVLFDHLKLEGGKKSGKTDAYATGSDILEELAENGHEIAAKVLEWRQLSKLKSTYSDAIPRQINRTTGRVHTSYALSSTSTGRLASSDPNLQNIPIRSVEGRKIREAFIAAEGYQLMSADYSQIELRLLAHIADIPSLKEAFKNGEDIHAATASQMFGVPLSEVNSDLRRKAKTINFGIIYGISAHGLAARLGISRTEAAAYIESYFNQYAGIKDYMERTKAQAREQGYVTTLYGRRCHLPAINDKNGSLRQFAERAAINAPLQGTAADIIKLAMIDVDKLLQEKACKSKMLLQVHDELIFEIAAGEENWLPPLIKKAMERSVSISVPLLVETGLGQHWGEIH